jgi:hypothetical protein
VVLHRLGNGRRAQVSRSGNGGLDGCEGKNACDRAVEKENRLWQSRDFYVFTHKFISNFNAGLSYLGAMSAAKAVFDCNLDGASQMAVDHPRHKERQSGGWPDWSGDNQDPAAIEASARNNAPAIVFGDVVRLLGMTVVIIIVIDLALRAFHLR